MAALSDMKRWARENMKGVENQLMPSFTPDLSELDEAGIRLDVRKTKEHGFFSTLCTCEAGLGFEEAKRFVEIVSDEAGDELKVSFTALFNTFDENIEMLRHAERVGCDSVLLGYPLNWLPESEQEIVEKTREMAEAAPELGIVLYATFKFNFEHFHPAGFPIHLMDQMADIENAVSVKVGDPSMVDPIEQICGDRIVVSTPFEGMLPGYVRNYGMQWIGAGPFEVYQTPEKPLLIDYFAALREGRWDEGMEIYWELAPLRGTFMSHMGPQLKLGTYHWPEHKYYQWLSGGNGGFTRQPVMELGLHEREEIKNARRMVGIEPPDESEASFFAGRTNYESHPVA